MTIKYLTKSFIVSFLDQVETLKADVSSLKRTVTSMAQTQQEILTLVKKFKKGMESEKFEMGNCSHTVSINPSHDFFVIH